MNVSAHTGLAVKTMIAKITRFIFPTSKKISKKSAFYYQHFCPDKRLSYSRQAENVGSNMTPAVKAAFLGRKQLACCRRALLFPGGRGR
jgi:hypothetical protein